MPATHRTRAAGAPYLPVVGRCGKGRRPHLPSPDSCLPRQSGRLCNKHGRLCNKLGRLCNTNGRLCNKHGRVQLIETQAVICCRARQQQVPPCEPQCNQSPARSEGGGGWGVGAGSTVLLFRPPRYRLQATGYRLPAASLTTDHWFCQCPCSSRNFSASRAAMHPVPAAVIACRYRRSCTSPHAYTPGIRVNTLLWVLM